MQYAKLLPLTLIHMLGNVFTNMSLGKVVVSFTHTIKAMEPFFSVLLSILFLGEDFAPTPIKLFKVDHLFRPRAILAPNPHCSRRPPPIYTRTKRLMLQRLDLPLLFLRLKCPGHPKEEISRRNKESSKRVKEFNQSNIVYLILILGENRIGFWSAMTSNLMNQSRNVYSKKILADKEDSLDDINLFSIITVMAFLLSAPLMLCVEGIKFSPSYLQNAGVNVKELFVRAALAGTSFYFYQQEWPMCVTYGAVAGYLFGMAVSLVLSPNSCPQEKGLCKNCLA
ncbi:Phosphoenolpyruvate/phosphate translocator 2 chloroplastic [Zea mays]|uniref:Phosphoenolpyruvate/phosphate translocator 2 chloroplastic n=1 Tax=Zea mays TaxID=4577 RepID=A0A1D6L5G5_MAIZE|nr:Phosphoenolpyruvate/phosphate translocator 2 chloroplastic [Zea mays]